MLAQENDYIASAARSMYSSVTDPRILKLCTRRQEEIDGDNHRRERLAELEKSDAEQKAQIAAQKSQLAEQEVQLAEQESQLAALTAKIEALEAHHNLIYTPPRTVLYSALRMSPFGAFA